MTAGGKGRGWEMDKMVEGVGGHCFRLQKEYVMGMKGVDGRGLQSMVL